MFLPLNIVQEKENISDFPRLDALKKITNSCESTNVRNIESDSLIYLHDSYVI